MHGDLIFVGGLLLGALSILSFLAAHSDGRRPYVAVFAFVLGAGMVLLAVLENPGVYSLRTIPDAFYRLVGLLIGSGS